MTLPLYRDHDAPATRPEGGHRGLWHDRFFDRYDDRDQWKIPEEGKASWVKDNANNIKSTNENDRLDHAAQRHLALVTALGGRGAVFQTDWHFATGLGLPHPVENGLAWHPTLGVPYLAGSGVKGLVRAWVEVWDESLDPESRTQRITRWFGDLKQAGGFLFFDALPIAPVTLAADVMTPHLGKWYEQGGEIEDWHREPERVPADWHAPVPVPFLVAKKPKLLFGIAPRTQDFAAELNEVFAALKQALEWLGAGAKTAVGYGVMEEKPDETADLQQRGAAAEQRQREAAELKRLEIARQAELAQMDPFARSLAEQIDARPDKGQSDIAYLIGLVKSGHWQGEDKQRVAQWLERRMQETKGQWKPQSQAKKPDKDREHQNTLLVMNWLKD